jgi:hypothetical protein
MKDPLLTKSRIFLFPTQTPTGLLCKRENLDSDVESRVQTLQKEELM